ncbi:MAG: DUF4474 domain-containing protein [Lachnospiraceae bacterium]|jgi:hypothetical protein|nr:DUF4474 domain-containing protein [Lachnospiraceae bacterium]MCI9326670.1 DUF4474 domain-containing protein [Lachnospiraceae bacterium]
MYFSIGIVIFALLLVFIFSGCRKRQAVKKVCSMTCMEKVSLLDSLIEPFGYCYDEKQDLISSRNDAWQREMGYTALFDYAASRFNMVFDFLPVYFPWQGKTWLIEFWKGQYGINTGAEVGVYHADRILSHSELSTAHFQCVDDREMLPVSFKLTKAGRPLACMSKKTWWLTAFLMGMFSRPGELELLVTIQFPDHEMRCGFLKALYQTEISNNLVRVCGNTVSVSFCGEIQRHYSFFGRLHRKWSQFTNRIFCRIYLFITRYFTCTLDRLLYLYYLLPFAFRRMLKPRRYCKCKKCGKNKRM